MADISNLSRLVTGITRNVNIQNNTLVVGSLKVGSVTPTELTKAILDRLISLQNGTDVDATYHTHDGRYYTESELASATSSSGSDLIGDDNTYTNFTPAAATVKGALSGIDAALAAAGSNTFSDAMFRVYDNGDNTKLIALEASAITTGTTRTITMPDANVDLGKVATAIQRDGSVTWTANQPVGGFKFTGLGAGSGAGDSVRFEQVILRDGTNAFTANQPMGSFKLTGLAAGSGAGDSVRYEQAILTSGANAFAADQSFGGFKATNLGDPTGGQDAVTLAYLNARIAGLKPKAAVRVASVANVVIATALENGDSVDGITLATGDRVLLKNQTAPEENGIYIVAASGAAARSTDFDSLSPIDEINGSWMAVQEGTQAGQIWVQFGTVATLGTDPITFEYWNPIAGLIGGDMITFAGSTFSVDLASDAGLESSNPGNVAGQLRVKLDGATLARSSSGLKVSDAGITATQLAAAVAGDGLTGGAGSALAVGAGDGISVAANAVAVSVAALVGQGIEDDGSNNFRISAAAAGAGLTGGAGSALAVGSGDASIAVAADAITVARDAAGAIGLSGTGIKANVDGTTVQISGNNLAIKADGIRDLYATFTNNTGSTINAGSVVIASQTDADEIELADADALATCEGVLGVVLANILDGASGKVQIAGRCTPTSVGAYDLGKRVYVSGTAGSSTKTAPSATNSVVFLMGIAVSTTEIVLGMHLEAVNE